MKGDFKAPDRLTPEVLRMLADGEDHSGDFISSWTGKAPEDDRRSGFRRPINRAPCCRSTAA